MTDYVSNVPISRPRVMDWDISWDCGSMVWNNDFGMFYNAIDQPDPIRLPAPVRRRQ